MLCLENKVLPTKGSKFENVNSLERKEPKIRLTPKGFQLQNNILGNVLSDSDTKAHRSH